MRFHGVLGEDSSDAEALACLVRRLREDRGLRRIKVKSHGYEGCGELFRKGAKQLKAWQTAGCVRAIVCYDADTDNPEERKQRVLREIIRASGVRISCFPVVPVQEIEAWFHADIEKLRELFNWCRGLRQENHPESINNPKEALRRLSRHPVTGHFHYHPPTHNKFMAECVDLGLVERRCPSFAALAAFVRSE